MTKKILGQFDLLGEQIPQKPGLFRARTGPGGGFFPHVKFGPVGLTDDRKGRCNETANRRGRIRRPITFLITDAEVRLSYCIR